MDRALKCMDTMSETHGFTSLHRIGSITVQCVSQCPVYDSKENSRSGLGILLIASREAFDTL